MIPEFTSADDAFAALFVALMLAAAAWNWNRRRRMTPAERRADTESLRDPGDV